MKKISSLCLTSMLVRSSLLRDVFAEPVDRNQTRAPEKIGIIESVVKIAALIIPPARDTKPEEEQVTYGTIPYFLQCPSTCLAPWMGDSWCDSACASAECGHDSGDCDGWCAPDCKPSWVGDGYCDVDCFREECQWDGTDCAKNFTKTQLHHPLPQHKMFDYSLCQKSCDRKLLHNNECDASCNSLECNFDGGDCYHQCAPDCANSWLGDGDCDSACNVGSCGFDKGDCKICTPGCAPEMVGNGVCDTVCNVQACQSDMGDCYAVCWVAESIDYRTEPFLYPHCRTEWKGDGYCDCFCMNEACDYDHGDCKGVDCSIEFALLHELNRKMNSTDYPFPLPYNATDILKTFVTEMTTRRTSYARPPYRH